MEKTHLEALCALFGGYPDPQKSHMLELRKHDLDLNQDDQDDLMTSNLEAFNNWQAYVIDKHTYISELKEDRVRGLFELLNGNRSPDEVESGTDGSLGSVASTSTPKTSEDAEEEFVICDSTGEVEKPKSSKKKKRVSENNDEESEDGVGQKNIQQEQEPPWAEQVRRIPVGKARLDYHLQLLITLPRWKCLLPLVLKELEDRKNTDPNLKKQAEKKFQARILQLEAYERGETQREQNRMLGIYMLKMIKQIEEGLDPESDEFKFFFVDGLARSFSFPT